MWWETENHLEVRGHELYIGGFKAEELAKKYGTPLYVYNGNRVVDNFTRIRDALETHSDREVRVHYAMKANSNPRILMLLSDEGAWCDTVSPGEAEIAAKYFQGGHVMFTGTSVSNQDLRDLLELDVRMNIDSFSQMGRLSRMVKPGRRISIRWNPGRGAGETGRTITAGPGVKFGIPEDKIFDAYKEALELGFDPIGLHQHIGSNWKGKDVDIFLETVDMTLEVACEVERLIKKPLEFIDFGGGPGIRYAEKEPEFDLDKYAKGICEKVNKSDLKARAIAIEPGRYIVGDAGILLMEINTVEDKGGLVVGVNAGFNIYGRHVMYSAPNEIGSCLKADTKPTGKYLVAGNLCESTDNFTGANEKLVPLPDPQEGEILFLLNAGAYGFSMASEYNSRPLPGEVMVLDGEDFGLAA